MNEGIFNYLDKYEVITRKYYSGYRRKVMGSITFILCSKKIYSLIPFKDHINIEAKAFVLHRKELLGNKITPKGMIQVYHNQEIPCELLKVIFKESLEDSMDLVCRCRFQHQHIH